MDNTYEERQRNLAHNMDEIGEERYKALRAMYLANGRTHQDLQEALSQDVDQFLEDPIGHLRKMGVPESHPIFLSPYEIAKRVVEYSEQVFKQWRILRLILERHEDRVRKRWMSKTRDQRKKVCRRKLPESLSAL